MAFKFEELRVWEIAINLAADVSVLNKKSRLTNVSFYHPRFKEQRIPLP